MTLDPDIAAMRAAECDAERAAILLTAPVSTLMRWRAAFRDLCRRAQFEEGEAYLDALALALTARRRRGEIIGDGPAALRLVGVIEKAGRADLLEYKGRAQP